MSYATVAFTKGGVVVADGVGATADLVALGNGGWTMVAVAKVVRALLKMRGSSWLRDVHDAMQS
jgi:hypothetical protein